MPRPISSDRYLAAFVPEKLTEDSKPEEEHPQLEPLIGKPDYLSITWLASQVNLYGEQHQAPRGVQASFPIGEGATFAVYRSKSSQPYVVKRPRQLFQQGTNEESVFDQLYSLHLELRVLTDKRIRLHPNIVKLLTVIWEEHPDDLGRYWPSLVLEFATLGTLSDYFERHEKTTLYVQHQICHGVGSGLEFLHQCGIVHGDVKCDNVLLFKSSSDNGIIPKLGDFGYSVFDGENARPLKGTYPFKAPELNKGVIPRGDIIYTDIYSFGLLVWQVSQEGHNPFEDSNVCSRPLSSTEAQQHIQSLKESGELLDLALRMLSEDKTCLRRVLELTIRHSPYERKLKDALQALGAEIQSNSSVLGRSTSLPPNRPHSVNSQFNLREMQHLGAPIQKQILTSLEKRTEAALERNDDRRSMAAMAIAAYCLERFGDRKPEEALEWILLAASLGNMQAKSDVYSISKALGLFSRDEERILSFLIEGARDGNPVAIKNLMADYPEKGKEVLRELKKMRRDGFLPFPDSASLKDYIRSYGVGMSESIKNSYGDTLLHLAVMCGDASALCLVLEESYSAIERVDIDVTNNQGQTPLLLAFITENFVAATTLLEHGANASKADRKGDTPFHWLHTFEASQMRTLADTLLKQTAAVNAISSLQLWDNYYQIPMPGGTPLQRAVARNNSEAVKILLDCGADALLSAPASELSTPLWIACTYHNFEVLELLLDSIKNVDVKKVVNGGESEKWPLGQPTLDAGYYFMNGATWGRMVRHREKHSLSVKATIETLWRWGAHQWLARSASEEGRGTLLIQAVMNHSLDIVKAVLDIYPSSINIPGRQKMTPLHRAVLRDREDLVNLLLSRGADPFATRLDGLDALSLYANYRQGLEIPRILLQKGLRFEVPSSGFQTPFFGAVKNRAFELATYILENTTEPGLMINASCVQGTNFHSPQVRVSILKYLLDEGAIFSLRALRYLLHLPDTYDKVDFIVLPSEGKSALHHLASYPRNIRDDVVGRALAVEILQYFSSSEEINLAGSLDGKTALWQAVRSLNYDMIDLLLSKGASPTIRSHDGQTPLSLLFIQIDHSKKHHHDDVIKKLEQIKNLFASYGYFLVDPGNVLE